MYLSVLDSGQTEHVSWLDIKEILLIDAGYKFCLYSA